MLDGFVTEWVFLDLKSSGDADCMALIIIDKKECRCDCYRNGATIPLDIPHVTLPVPADEENKAIVTDWIETVKKSSLSRLAARVTLKIDAFYLPEIMTHVG